jgi:hypothetical protein
MKVYSFETNQGYYEFYDLRKARKTALELAKINNIEVLVTCISKPSYSQDWYTAMPDGTWHTDMKGFKADN